MSAREELYAALMAGGYHSPARSERASEKIDAYRAEVLREAAETVRSMAPKYLDDETDQHVFWVLDGVATKLEGQS